MSKPWGVAIPGFAMAAAELPEVEGLLRLDNPEIGAGPHWDAASYSLEDVARFHLETILKLGCERLEIVGMSMGGMITAILAAHLRAMLPRQTSFRILVSSPNAATNPAITAAMLAEWQTAKPGNVDDFARILRPFFGDSFAKAQPAAMAAYFSYRALGQNRQSPRAFFRQLSALTAYDGSRYWPAVDPREMTVISGTEDYVLGPSHGADIARLNPAVHVREIATLGHMINIERPEFFSREIP